MGIATLNPSYGLIDADNASAAIVEGLSEEIANIKRIYGESNAHSPD